MGQLSSDVVLRAKEGDQAACRELWTALSPQVAGYLRGRGAQEPEDLTSEVFLALFRALPGFEGDVSALRALLFTIAHHRLVDDLRRRACRPDPVSWETVLDPRRASSAEDGALERDAAMRVKVLLDGLSPDQREVLVLRILGDLTVDQVATVLGKRPGAVKALQRRGLNALRKKIDSGRTPVGVSNDDR